MMWNIDGITWPGKLFTPWDRSSREREPASRSWRRREAVTRDRVALRVEQDLEQVLGRELLMPLAQRERLGGLDEALGAVGVFVEIHDLFPRPVPNARGAVGTSSLG
jgi:hypothetical protein